MDVPISYHGKPLPNECISFSSKQGKKIFVQALASGYMEGYFPLASQFHTQSDPHFCGLGSLVNVLNALSIDPGRTWRHPWRWFSEEMLNCCSPLESILKNGISLAELGCLARCNGATCDVHFAEDSSIEEFRKTIMKCSKSGTTHVIASYNRKALGQTGEGHFSPIGGYHPEQDLDVARFKYPPHWVSLSKLFNALTHIDSSTGRSRGFLVLSRAKAETPIFCRIVAGAESWHGLVNQFCVSLPQLFSELAEQVTEEVTDSKQTNKALKTLLTKAIEGLTQTNSNGDNALSNFKPLINKEQIESMTVSAMNDSENLRSKSENLLNDIHSTFVYDVVSKIDLKGSTQPEIIVVAIMLVFHVIDRCRCTDMGKKLNRFYPETSLDSYPYLKQEVLGLLSILQQLESFCSCGCIYCSALNENKQKNSA